MDNLQQVKNHKYQVPPKFFQQLAPALVLMVLISFAKCVKFMISSVSTKEVK